jgi:hypothetical protein
MFENESNSEHRDFESCLIAMRKELSDIDKRILAQEIHLQHHKGSVENLRNDFMDLQGSFRIDIERLQNTLHTDIKMIQDTLNDIIKKQAVSEAQVKTSVNIGKWLVDKAPWILAIGSSLTAVVQFTKDKTP